ncbi:lanthionine synthetase LanC family protein [Hymenobacter elongatus]|uniref:lanthionine synthetase LanC family protein n=1 Tax=Hymenobacter elongatus TaxID=877208 RepID=UPI001AEC53C3|nr:lanthionine synthetase LanC family protein [Hymenobacter elongatus]
MKEEFVKIWADTHARLTTVSRATTTVSDQIGFSIYYYSVYVAFGREADKLLALQLFNQLTADLARSAAPTLSPEHAVGVAWLSARFAAAGHAEPGISSLLEALDQRLFAEAQGLLQQHKPLARMDLFRTLRYFMLRQPDLVAGGYLWRTLQLLQGATAGSQYSRLQPTGLPNPVEQSTVLNLGLENGVAGELLLLIKLQQAGENHESLKEIVRQGIRYLLNTKREVDFSTGRYAVFPDDVSLANQEATFSNELSWRNSDLGHSLLLYEAHRLLADEELKKIAELVGLNTLLRTDFRATAIHSSSFSQGASGVAHLYRRLYQASGHESYQKGYTFWLNQTRSWLTQELATDLETLRGEKDYQDLVRVSLVLLSAITPQELQWDEILL